MTTPAPIDRRFDVSTAVGEHLEQAAWLFLPEAGSAPKAVLLCLSGGTYDRHYWHLEVPDRDGYSFGHHLARKGFVVVAVDHLGVGASPDPSAGPVGLELLATGDAEVARQVRSRLGEGTLHPALPPADVPMIGIGHSMGACVVVVAQATSAVFDGVVLLGHSIPAVAPVPADEVASEIARNTEIVCGIAGQAPAATSLRLDRGALHKLFYAADVPAAVVAADDEVASRVPARAAAEVLTHAYVAGFAARVSVPVLLGFGAELDLASDVDAEPSAYPASSEVTVYRLDGSRHCHNLAGRRTELWDAIAAWSERLG